jgi:hypothetical protein
MPEMSEIDYDYGVLIDRLIQDFRPVKRLWPIRVRLLLWILVEVAILAVVILVNGRADLETIFNSHNHGFDAAGCFLVSIAAAWVALRNSIPGRETSATELTMLGLGIIAASVIVQFEPLAQTLLSSDTKIRSAGALMIVVGFHAEGRGGILPLALPQRTLE